MNPQLSRKTRGRWHPLVISFYIFIDCSTPSPITIKPPNMFQLQASLANTMAPHYKSTVVISDLSQTRCFPCPMQTRQSPCGVGTRYVNTVTISRAVTPRVTPLIETCNSLGILRFMQKKNYFITGATGFLAKVFIEKLLRAAPETGKIFILTKAKDQEAAKKRLYDEIINSDLFEILRQTHGESYEAFMTSKLIPVVGDISDNNLGMNTETANNIAKEIDVIVSSAASTNFYDRYDYALSINTSGPDRLMKFASKCHKLSLFLHFSTAYASGIRQGIVPETPLRGLDSDSELKLASEAARNFHSKEVDQKMKELGRERAVMHGWQNTYTLTKAMGEMVIDRSRGDLPVVIIRPSIVESSYREPFHGWIQGDRMADPVILAYGKGQLPGFFADPQTVVDIVPVDMVVNAAMAAMAKHGVDSTAGMNVYHVTSSMVNPVSARNILDFTRQHLCISPLKNPKGEDIMIEPMKFHRSLEDFTSYISDIITEHEKKKNGQLSTISKSKWRKKKINYFVDLAKTYEPITFTKARYDNTNTRRLMEDMTMEERKMFGFNTGTIDWEDYFVNVHIPGLKRHVLQEKIVMKEI